MTAPHHTKAARPGRHEAGPRERLEGALARTLEAVVGVALVVAAAVLATSGAPTPVRALVVLPVLVGVAGRGATTLLLHRRLTERDGEGDPVVDEQTLRLVAPVLFGVIATLAAILAVSALRLTITPTTVTVACAVVASALHVAAVVLRRDAPSRSGRRARARRLVGTAVPGVAALALLIVGVAGARAVESEQVERYTQLSLVDPGVYATGGLRSAPGTRFQVAWVLRAYAMPLADSPPVSLTVAGAVPSGLQKRALAPSTDVTDADASRRGLVSAVAPRAPGLYRLALSVGAGDQAQTLYLVLEVKAR